jgi:hypothetical protein
MLEFIVLGQIPGTHIVLSFELVLGIVAFGLGMLTSRLVARHYEERVLQAIPELRHYLRLRVRA